MISDVHDLEVVEVGVRDNTAPVIALDLAQQIYFLVRSVLFSQELSACCHALRGDHFACLLHHLVVAVAYCISFCIFV